MIVDVELIGPDLARVTKTPSTLARIVLGRQTSERYAVRSSVGNVWLWDDTGRIVGDDVLRALGAELDRCKQELAS